MDALDGNAIAGELFAAFGHEMTTVVGTCTSCGASSAIAELRVYISGPGTVARCPGCASVAIVLARGTARLSAYELAEPRDGGLTDVSSGQDELGLGNGERIRQLMAGADPELGEHLAQVPLHGARTEEESRTDLRVRQSIASEPRDLPLLRRQLIARLGGPRAHPLACGQQLTLGAFGERLHPDGHEQLVCSAELLAGILAPALAAQPLPVEEMRARELGPESRAPDAVDGFAVQALGGLALAEQCARPGVDAEPPIGVAGLRVLGESREGASCELARSRSWWRPRSARSAPTKR